MHPPYEEQTYDGRGIRWRSRDSQFVTDSFHVVFDSEVENATYVKVAKDVLWKFERFGSGLYYFDVAMNRNANNGTVSNYSFNTTVIEASVHLSPSESTLVNSNYK